MSWIDDATALDLGPLVERLLVDRKILARGLAHPAAMMSESDDTPDRLIMRAVANDDSLQFSQLLKTYGAVPVSPRNLFKLLSNKENVLLYPGGVREAYHRKGNPTSIRNVSNMTQERTTNYSGRMSLNL